MWRTALARWWEPQKIYYTKVYQEVYVGLAIVSYFYYKLSFGGKKKVEDKCSPGHH